MLKASSIRTPHYSKANYRLLTGVQTLQPARGSWDLKELNQVAKDLLNLC